MSCWKRALLSCLLWLRCCRRRAVDEVLCCPLDTVEPKHTMRKLENGLLMDPGAGATVVNGAAVWPEFPFGPWQDHAPGRCSWGPDPRGSPTKASATSG